MNYIDIYHRTGLYKQTTPSGIGAEGSGIVEAIGSNVTTVKVGDRVAYGSGPLGSYAELRNINAAHLCRLPEEISFEEGAGIMLQGMTVSYLIKKTFSVQAGQTVLWHACAGGVGLLAIQWLKSLGATVIGTAGSDQKCAVAKKFGADHVINYKTDNFVARVKEITNGVGVPVVYDSVGKDTFLGSLECLQPRG